MAAIDVKGSPLPWHIPDEKIKGIGLLDSEKATVDNLCRLVELRISLNPQFELEYTKYLARLRSDGYKMRRLQREALTYLGEILQNHLCL